MYDQPKGGFMPFESNPSFAPIHQKTYSPKSRMVTAMLCMCFGWMGVHRFYVGKIGTGILMMLTIGLFGLWTLVDLFIVILGKFKDSDGRQVFRWFEEGSIIREI